MIIFNIFKYGFGYFWYSPNKFNLLNYRIIYNQLNGIEFVVKWDLFYLNLTISLFKYKYLAICILWFREYLYNIYLSLNPFKVIFYTNEKFVSGMSYIILFESRQDLINNIRVSHLLKNSQILVLNTKIILVNPLKLFFTCLTKLSFVDIFKFRLDCINFDLQISEGNVKFHIYEGRSSYFRALYSYLISQSINLKISFFWLKPSSLPYSKLDLLSNSNLDYPVDLIRPMRNSNLTIHKLNDLIIFDQTILIVLSTFHSGEDLSNWIRQIKSIFKAPAYAYALHPSVHQTLILDLQKDEFIDYNKNNYDVNYKYFIGFDSTLLFAAENSCKVVYSIAFNDNDFDFLKEVTDLNSIYFFPS